eukprot:497400_1
MVCKYQTITHRRMSCVVLSFSLMQIRSNKIFQISCRIIVPCLGIGIFFIASFSLLSSCSLCLALHNSLIAYLLCKRYNSLLPITNPIYTVSHLRCKDIDETFDCLCLSIATWGH